MDLSISYHPITQEQMREWYFNTFEDMGAAEALALRIPKEQLKEHSLKSVEAYNKNKYKEMIKRSRELEYTSFNKWHGYFIAIVQGFFEKFYFVQGSALSGILDTSFHSTYITPWAEVIPSDYIEDLQASSKLEGPYSAGAYMSPEQVTKLLHDYENDAYIKELLNEQFEGRKIDVFLAALKYAKENNQGLIEAAKVVEQSEGVFEEPSCFSNIFNCDVMSAAVFTSDMAKHFDDIYKGTSE